MLNIFVINLNERIDRFNRIKSDFSHPNINIIRIEAIKKNPGWIGLYDTNKSIIKKAIDENMDNILIVEDDCKLEFNISEFMDRFIKIKDWLDNNSDKLDIYNGGINFYSIESNFQNDIFHVNNLVSNKSKNYLFLIENFLWACAQFIYINKKAFFKIYNDSQLKCWDLFLNKYKTIFSYPLLTTQYSSYSNIEKREVNYDNYFNKTKVKLKYHIIRNKLL
jgi:hypothetical protein